MGMDEKRVGCLSSHGGCWFDFILLFTSSIFGNKNINDINNFFFVGFAIL